MNQLSRGLFVVLSKKTLNNNLHIFGFRRKPSTSAAIVKFYSSTDSPSSGNNDDGSPKKANQSKSKAVRAKTPIGKLDELEVGQHPYQEKEPLPPWPDNTNPNTGEIGGPRGPEPTRYGDWERKGRVTDF